MTTAKNKVRKPFTAKRRVGAGVWGGATTLLAYLLSFGSVPVFIVLLFVISAILPVMAPPSLQQLRAAGQEVRVENVAGSRRSASATSTSWVATPS
ncbi:MAG TPA: hypothetical protein VME20_03335 [Acidimicrobiales bacterium]|nr:hypothetical protein [Acidimicrobiales bacterium]